MNEISFRIYYPDGSYNTHYREMEIKEIPKWVAAYWYTHPTARDISIIIKKSKEE